MYYAVDTPNLTTYYTVADASAIAKMNPRVGNTGVELTHLAVP